jgi:Fe-S cluster assembly protein SufD
MSELAEKLAPATALRKDDFAPIRERAQRALMQHGFPDLKTEEWKYTPIKLLEKREFSDREDTPAPAYELPFEADVLRFDNGLLDPDAAVLPEGVRLVAAEPGDFAEVDYAGRADAFAWLNTARFEQAWRLIIEARLSRPLVLAFATGPSFSAAVHPRLFIECADHAEATLIEDHRHLGAGLVNAVADIRLQAGSRLAHVIRRRGDDSMGVVRTTVEVGRDARYTGHILDTGQRLGRHDLSVALLEAGASGEIDGTALIDSKQHVDYHTTIEHRVGHTDSRESFRMLGDGTGVGVFNGRIHIHEGADESHSDLNTANLLLGEQARINAKPELEIYAEDVTASHGATIGQLDDDALFYLRTRGIPADQANSLLKYGFAAAPLEDHEDEPVRDWLLAELQEQL